MIPTMLAATLLCCAVRTASVIVRAASPLRPSSFTMSFATFTGSPPAKPTIEIASTTIGKSARKPRMLNAAARLAPRSAPKRRCTLTAWRRSGWRSSAASNPVESRSLRDTEATVAVSLVREPDVARVAGEQHARIENASRVARALQRSLCRELGLRQRTRECLALGDSDAVLGADAATELDDEIEDRVVDSRVCSSRS